MSGIYNPGIQPNTTATLASLTSTNVVTASQFTTTGGALNLVAVDSRVTGGTGSWSGNNVLFTTNSNAVAQADFYSAGGLSGGMHIRNTSYLGFGILSSAPDVILGRLAAANLVLGGLAAASPVAQVLQSQESRAGTDTNVAGSNFTIRSGLGTGTATPSSLIFSSPTTTATGSAAQIQTEAFRVNNGALKMATAAPLSVASGTNQRAGNLTLVGGTLVVNNTTVTANTIVMLTRKTSGGTIGTAITYTLSAGTSFTVTSDNILDTSTFSYLLVEVP